LETFKDLFDGSLGTWLGDDLSIELKEGVKLYHARAFPIPKSREELLKKEFTQSCKLGVLKQVNHMGSTSFHPSQERWISEIHF